MTLPLIGAIEAGGTTIRCAVARTLEEMVEVAVVDVPTSSPEQSLDVVTTFFQPFADRGELAAIGVASFGPLNTETSTIADTSPKIAWRNLNWRQQLVSRLGDLRVVVDTDTNAAVLAESRYGNASGVEVAVYLTVGTGIGGAIAVNGSPLHGIGHPEVGHQLIARAPGDHHKGTCAFHHDCLEGFASGTAIVERYGAPASQLDELHEGLQFEAHYLAIACANLTTMVAAECIVLGGGVMEARGLRSRVAERAAHLLNGYLPHGQVRDHSLSTIVAPKFENSGLIGAWLLARELV